MFILNEHMSDAQRQTTKFVLSQKPVKVLPRSATSKRAWLLQWRNCLRKINDRFHSCYIWLWAFDVAAFVSQCLRKCTHTHRHTPKHACKCKRLHSEAVALCGKTTMPICVLDALPKEIPYWRQKVKYFRLLHCSCFAYTESLIT